MSKPFLVLGFVLFCIQSSALTSDAINMVSVLEKSTQEPEYPSKKVEKYNRSKHFGGWVRQGEEIPCQNTRALVLIRQAESPDHIKYNDTECAVVSGKWFEPYAGNLVKKATELQIDHVVPLKHAYYSGAWAWEPARRCHYANFIKNDLHLLAVLAHENESKSDNGPDEYLPPETSFQCEYVSHWMKIKLIWELTVSQSEIDAIKTVVKKQSCKPADLQVSQQWLKEQKAQSLEPIEPCADFGAN